MPKGTHRPLETRKAGAQKAYAICQERLSHLTVKAAQIALKEGRLSMRMQRIANQIKNLDELGLRAAEQAAKEQEVSAAIEAASKEPVIPI